MLCMLFSLYPYNVSLSGDDFPQVFRIFLQILFSFPGNYRIFRTKPDNFGKNLLPNILAPGGLNLIRII